MSLPKNSNVHKININGCKRDLSLFEVKPGLKIAVLNILGDVELVKAASNGLAKKLNNVNYDVLVTAEAKSIPLAYELSAVTGKPYVVLRKNYKSYMGDTIKAVSNSITTGKEQFLYLDEKDIDLISGAKVILIDDVISTGSTLKAMKEVMDKSNSEVVSSAAIFTEGEADKISDIICLGHLPLFYD